MTTRTRRRPAEVIATVVVLVFLGITALAGGLELTFGSWAVSMFPDDWLERLPIIDSWVVPGLVLGIGFGLGSLLTAYGIVARPRRRWAVFAERWTAHHWSWLATLLIGAGHLVWIALEVIYLSGMSWHLSGMS